MRKIKFLCLIKLSILLCSCVVSCSQSKTTTKAENLSPSVVSLPEKAEKVCGDRPPEDPTSYPVSFYPVSVEYSVDNLAKIKKHFCEDALKRYSSQAKKDIIQVGSFTGKEKAESFRAKLSQHFRQVTIGEPTIVEKLKTEVSDQKSDNGNLDTVESIAQAALLNSKQTQNLLDLENSNMVYRPKSDVSFEMGKVKVLVPTYVPVGFKLVDFFRVPPNEYNAELRYRLSYKSLTGEVFDISTLQLLGDGPAFQRDSGRISHKLLGQIRLSYVEFDRLKNSAISFKVPYQLVYQGQSTGYYFYSGSSGKAISIQESIKIVNSLKALNPRTTFDFLPGDNRW